MDQYQNFRLQRLSDGLVYQFEKEKGTNRSAIYRRTDGAVRIRFDAEFGWSTWDENQLTGRAWDVSTQRQGDFPTAGIWVSRKGAKSYVYELIYAGPDGGVSLTAAGSTEAAQKG